MKLSRPQQAVFWRGFAAAWDARCRASGADPGDGVARERWRREVLHGSAGVFSLKQVRRGRDFDLVMAALETESGAGIRWQMRAGNGDANRAAHELERARRSAGVTAAYVSAIAANMGLPPPEKCSPDETRKLIAALRLHGARHPQPEPAGNPF